MGEVSDRDTNHFGMLANLASSAIPTAYGTRRRLWSARDEVCRLEALLASAQASLAAAEREDEQTQQLLRDLFGQLRTEHAQLLQAEGGRQEVSVDKAPKE